MFWEVCRTSTFAPITNTNAYALIASGDRNAFEQAFRMHYAPLCAFAVQYVKDQDAAEDLVQDLFVRVWQDREKINVSTSLKSYLFTSVRNRALNAMKVNARMRPLDEERMDHVTDAEHDEAEYTDRTARVHAAIEMLPEERRKVFKLSRNEGLKYHEIAARLGISIKTVENQMGKALKTLRVELADLVPTALIGWLIWFFGGQ